MGVHTYLMWLSGKHLVGWILGLGLVAGSNVRNNSAIKPDDPEETTKNLLKRKEKPVGTLADEEFNKFNDKDYKFTEQNKQIKSFGAFRTAGRRRGSMVSLSTKVKPLPHQPQKDVETLSVWSLTENLLDSHRYATILNLHVKIAEKKKLIFKKKEIATTSLITVTELKTNHGPQ